MAYVDGLPTCYRAASPNDKCEFCGQPATAMRCRMDSPKAHYVCETHKGTEIDWAADVMADKKEPRLVERIHVWMKKAAGA